MEKKTILIIEDNADDIELILLSLKQAKIMNKVDIVFDGEQALDYLFCCGKYQDRDCKDMPVLILLDLNLPKINGHQVLETIKQREETKTIPVTIFTSSNEESDLIRAYNFGANSYIQKPVNFESFADTIKQMSLYWLLINKIPE